jgi:serine/threonine protein phosphatase PrpC
LVFLVLNIHFPVVALTTDHDLSDKAERERVEKRGGVVEMFECSFCRGWSFLMVACFGRVKGCYRVNGKLGVSRAFGNRRLKRGAVPPVVDAAPTVAGKALLGEALVASSDGLWQYADPGKVFAQLRGSAQSAEEAALAVIEYLIDAPSTQLMEHDNVVLAVAKFAHGSLPPTVADRLVLYQQAHQNEG